MPGISAAVPNHSLPLALEALLRPTLRAVAVAVRVVDGLVPSAVGEVAVVASQEPEAVTVMVLTGPCQLGLLLGRARDGRASRVRGRRDLRDIVRTR